MPQNACAWKVVQDALQAKRLRQQETSGGHVPTFGMLFFCLVFSKLAAIPLRRGAYSQPSSFIPLLRALHPFTYPIP
jgi:hypothetical protein